MDQFKVPTIETDRLILRAVTLEDAVDMFEYASQKIVCDYTLFAPHETLDETRNLIPLLFTTRPDRNMVEAFAIVEKTTHKMIGTCDFWPSKGFECYEMGYVLNPSYWGRGIMTEAATAVMKFAFDDFGVRRLEISHMADNIGSGKVIENLGFRFEGVRRKAVKAHKDGSFQDLKIFALLKEEYDDKKTK